MPAIAILPQAAWVKQLHFIIYSSRSKHQCIVVVGCGKQEKFTVSAYQKVLAAAINEIKRNKSSNFINCLTELDVSEVDAMTKAQLAVTAIDSSMYVYNETKPSAKTKTSLKKQKLLTTSSKRNFRYT